MIKNILAPDFFNNADTKYESWTVTKISQEVFMDYKSSPSPTSFGN